MNGLPERNKSLYDFFKAEHDIIALSLCEIHSIIFFISDSSILLKILPYFEYFPTKVIYLHLLKVFLHSFLFYFLLNESRLQIRGIKKENGYIIIPAS